MSMRLLYLHNKSLTENLANIIQVLHMCHAFQKIGVETTLAVPKDSKYSESDIYDLINEKTGRRPGFKIVFFPLCTIAGRGAALGAYYGARSLLAKIKDVDVCYVRSIFMNHLALSQGHKVVYESHGSILHTKSKWLNKIYRRRLLRDVCSVNQVLFVAISQALTNVWSKRGVADKKILTLHDGVSEEDYIRVKSRDDARKPLGIEYKKKLVVYAGSLYKDRGIENILDLAKTFKDVLFYVIGGPEKEKDLYKSIALQSGLVNMVCVGHIPHHKVKDYLFAADVLLMLWSANVPTINICSPLKVFEYMAAGRIIVGHGFPTIKEILKHQETALLTNPNSYQDLERKLRYGLSLDYPNPISERARSLVLREYTWESRAKSIMKALQIKI